MDEEKGSTVLKLKIVPPFLFLIFVIIFLVFIFSYLDSNMIL